MKRPVPYPTVRLALIIAASILVAVEQIAVVGPALNEGEAEADTSVADTAR